MRFQLSSPANNLRMGMGGTVFVNIWLKVCLEVDSVKVLPALLLFGHCWVVEICNFRPAVIAL